MTPPTAPDASDALYTTLATKAKDHAVSRGLSFEWGYGFLNAMWPTISAAVVAASRPSTSGGTENVADERGTHGS